MNKVLILSEVQDSSTNQVMDWIIPNCEVLRINHEDKVELKKGINLYFF